MELKGLYPGRENYYKKQLVKLENSNIISDTDKADFKTFCTALLSTGKAKQYRAGKLLCHFIWMAEQMKPDFRSASLFDIQQLIMEINSVDKTEATKADYRRSLKQFFYWYEDFDDRMLSNDLIVRKNASRIYKYLAKEVTTKYKKPRIDSNNILDDDDIKAILEKGCKTIQDKAIITTLHETGMRSGELLLIKVGGFEVDERGIGSLFTGDGKTGSRQVDVIKCVPYIQDHIRTHPNGGDPSTLLFYFIDQRNGKNDVFNHRRFYGYVRKMIRRSGLKKKANPHWFRHSRASLDAIDGTMSKTVRKKKMSWSDSSKMMANYTHLGRKEVRRAWMKANGIKDDEVEEEEFLKCICQRMVSSRLSYCPHCGRPTSLKVVEKERAQQHSFQDEIKELFLLIPKKPKMKREFLKVLEFAMDLSKDSKMLEEFMEFRGEKNER